MPNIAVVGSISMDLVAVSKKRPKAGETVIGEAFHTIPGGKGANQAVAAARLGANVAMIGAVGNDNYGTVVRKNLENERVFIDYVVPVTDAVTGIAHIVLAEEDNSIVVVQGANALVNESVVNRSKDLLIKADMVVLQLEIPLETVKYVLAICEEHKIPVMLNPAPAQVLSADILEKATYITPNEHECRIVLDDFTSPIEELLAKYPNKLLMTEGSNGVRFHNGTEIVHVPSIAVDVVDTTGAGDTFNGALAVALSEGETLQKAIRFANIAGGLSVTKLGAQGGMPTRDNVSARAVEVLKQLGYEPIVTEHCAKVSIVGAGMAGIPGVTAKIVTALAEKGIQILQSADSHTTIWVLVKETDLVEAVNALHSAFELSKEKQLEQ